MGHIVLDLTSLAYQPKKRERSVHPKRHVSFALTDLKSVYPDRKMRDIVPLPQSFAPARNFFVFANSEMETCWEICVILFQRNLHVRPELMCLKHAMCLYCSPFQAHQFLPFRKHFLPLDHPTLSSSDHQSLSCVCSSPKCALPILLNPPLPFPFPSNLTILKLSGLPNVLVVVMFPKT